MLQLSIEALLCELIVSAVAEDSKRYPGLVASLPHVSVLGTIWLWRDTGDAERIAAHAEGRFWFVLPSLPMFLLIPALLRRSVSFWPALATRCALTIALYTLTTWIGPKFGLRL